MFLNISYPVSEFVLEDCSSWKEGAIGEEGLDVNLLTLLPV